MPLLTWFFGISRFDDDEPFEPSHPPAGNNNAPADEDQFDDDLDDVIARNHETLTQAQATQSSLLLSGDAANGPDEISESEEDDDGDLLDSQRLQVWLHLHDFFEVLISCKIHSRCNESSWATEHRSNRRWVTCSCRSQTTSTKTTRPSMKVCPRQSLT